ncbi:MAG: hypothetical protein AAGM67_09780 [Bacteroidota bacterium]
MQSINRSFVLMILMIATFGLAIAQPPEAEPGRRGGMRNLDPEQIALRQTKKMQTELELTEAQYFDVQAVNLEYAELMKAAMAENQGDRMAMREVMLDLRAKRIKAMKPVLEKDQYKAFRKAEMERQEAMQNRGPRGEGGRPPRPADN